MKTKLGKNKLVQNVQAGLTDSLKSQMQETKSLLLAKSQMRTHVKNQVGKDKTVLITGASSGIGAGMARGFAKLGYNLAICARRTDRLEALKQELLEINPNSQVEFLALDVSDYDQVFTVFKAFQTTFKTIDRVIVNAGVGAGRRVGTGHFDINKHTAEIDFVAALAQCEAAMEIFRAQNFGHLVAISSMSAMRGMPKHLTVYAASKAGLAHLAEGIRAEMYADNTPIKVTTIYPGYIRTEINEGSAKLPFEVSEKTGSEALVAAIESGVEEAVVPTLPWLLVGKALRHLPLNLVQKMI